MKNRVQYYSGGRWLTLGDYENEARAVEVAQEYQRQNPSTRVRAVATQFSKKELCEACGGTGTRYKSFAASSGVSCYACGGSGRPIL